MLYVHSECIKNVKEMGHEHCKQVAREFICLKDEDFFQCLNQRGKLKNKLEEYEEAVKRGD